MNWNDGRAHAALIAMWEAAIAAADPLTCLAPHLPEPPAKGRIIVVGAGKAAAKMALAVETAWAHLPLSGLVVTTHGADLPAPPANRRIAVRFGNHPTPDAQGAEAAAEMLAMVQGLTADDLVLALISGGGSSLSTLPAPGLTLDDMIAVNRELLRSGAPISAMNCVRKHLSAFSGGRLAAAAHPARVVTLAISDVPGDDPGTIASGPTVPDATTFAEARAIVARHGMTLPAAAQAQLEAAAVESPKTLANGSFHLIATPMMALHAMAKAARAHGLAAIILGDALEGEARHLGTVLAGIALSAASHGQPLPGPCVLLSGGETTVTIPAGTQGSGGRSTECLLGMALALKAHPRIWALCADTDGIDGRSNAAGAWLTPHTLGQSSLNGQTCLDTHTSYALFENAGTLLITGPTLTNVNDVRAVIIG
jgi:glycerate-2-kinase